MPSTLTSARALRKSLRLPRSFPRVAHWLFDESDSPFHSDAPLLTAHGFTASVAIQIRDQWQNFGSMFDPFQLEPFLDSEDHQSGAVPLDVATSSPEYGSDGRLVSSACTCDLDVVFTPVTYVSSNIVVGYTFCSGSSFDREMLPVPQGTFRGRTHMLGRFAYDLDNDHTIILQHGLTPTVSGIVDITSNGLSRTRCFYSVPNLQYSPERLPLSPLSMVSVTELRTRFENLFSKSTVPNSDLDTNKSLDITLPLPDVRLRDGSIDDNGGLHQISTTHAANNATVSKNYMKDLMEITSKLNNLSYVLEGTYSGSSVCRIIVRNVSTPGLRHSGGVYTEHLSLSRNARRECVCHVWQLYCESAFGMRSERRGAGLVVVHSKTSRSSSCGTVRGQVEDTSGPPEVKLNETRKKRKGEKKSAHIIDLKSDSENRWQVTTGKIKKTCARKRKLMPWTENNLDRMKLSFLTDTTVGPDG